MPLLPRFSVSVVRESLARLAATQVATRGESLRHTAFDEVCVRIAESTSRVRVHEAYSSVTNARGRTLCVRGARLGPARRVVLLRRFRRRTLVKGKGGA